MGYPRFDLAGPTVDLTGQRIGHLTALEARRENGRTLWRCRCDCGREIWCRQDTLKPEKTGRSCGCKRWRMPPDGRPQHGQYGTPENGVWRAMIARCNNPNVKNYDRYGGRGIRVCDRWLHSFAAFIEDMGPRPSPDHSIDRIDNDGDYEPGNCRWATREEQMSNRHVTRKATAFGRTKCLSDWQRETGIPAKTIWGRMKKGWPAERAVSEPVRSSS